MWLQMGVSWGVVFEQGTNMICFIFLKFHSGSAVRDTRLSGALQGAGAGAAAAAVAKGKVDVMSPLEPQLLLSKAELWTKPFPKAGNVENWRGKASPPPQPSEGPGKQDPSSVREDLQILTQES